MARNITFDDGTVIRGATDDELVRAAEAHIRTVHPRLAGQLSRKEILALAVDIKETEEP